MAYIWEGEMECQEYLKRWVLDAKQSTRIEDLQPSKSFVDHARFFAVYLLLQLFILIDHMFQMFNIPKTI